MSTQLKFHTQAKRQLWKQTWKLKNSVTVVVVNVYIYLKNDYIIKTHFMIYFF